MRMLLTRLMVGVAFATLPLAIGCATAPSGEVDLPPQTLTEAPTSTAEQEAALVASGHPAPEEELEELEEFEEPEPDAAEPKARELADRKQTIVIQSGTASEVTPRTLLQASASERERRAATDAPVVVITNRNLAEMAEGGQISVISGPGDASPGATAPADGGEQGAAGAKTTDGAVPPTASAPAPATAATAPANDAVSAGLAEEYWRGQALKIRLDWKAAVEEVDELQSEAADLRRRFYEEDDPFYRDNEIKPSWDRALDRLQEAKEEAAVQERKLTRFLDEGRRSGALPGWLREGSEFEPQPTPDRSPSERRRTDDPWEPKVLDEQPRDP